MKSASVPKVKCVLVTRINNGAEMSLNEAYNHAAKLEIVNE